MGGAGADSFLVQVAAGEAAVAAGAVLQVGAVAVRGRDPVLGL